MQPFPIDGHYKTDVISGVRHSRLNSIVPLVLHTVCFMQLLGTLALYYKFLGTASTLLRRVISRVDHNVELLLLLMIISIYYLYIYHVHDNCHLIMLHVFYNKRIHKLMTGTSCGFLLTKSSNFPCIISLFSSIYMIMLF
jgi:hypothetical protein